jgi:antitoxin (DNA-binding transcriptional repressor) of toxin-antitoxin stability system
MKLAIEQEVLISRAGKPVARLIPHAVVAVAPVFGGDRGKLVVPDDFDSPLPDGVLDAFEGRRRWESCLIRTAGCGFAPAPNVSQRPRWLD